MAKSQVKGSKTAKKKPPFQHGSGGSIIVLLTNVAGGFAVTLVRNETQRHSAALKSAGQSPIGLLPLDCRCCPLRLNASMWCHAVRSRFVSFESFANQDVIRSRRGWLSDSSHWISPTCANAQLRFTTPRFARGNSGGWLDAIESTEKPDCLVAALGDSVDSRRTSNYSPWSL